MPKALQEQYEAALEMERQARTRCYDKAGHLLVLVKGPDGNTQTNPYLLEWHRALETTRSLARELGITEPPNEGEPVPIMEATRDGDRLGALNALALILAEAINNNKGHGLPGLSKEYRETLTAIKEIKDAEPGDDAIGRLVAEGAARADRLGLAVV